jgi:hypothetical protein
MKTMNRMIVILALVVAGTAVSSYAQDKPKKEKAENKKEEKKEKKEKKDMKKEKKKPGTN